LFRSTSESSFVTDKKSKTLQNQKLMKKFKLVFVIMMSMAFISLTSCNKDSDEADNPVLGGGTMTLKVDGTSWNASLASQAINTNGIINVTGSDSDAHQVAITLMNVTEPGTYKVGTMASQHGIRWTEGLNSTDTYVANFSIGSGTITITELSSTKIKGSFTGTVANTSQNTKSISDGTFDVSF